MTAYRERATTQADKKPELESVFPPSGAYTGAYIDFGETEDRVTLEAVEDFEKLVGRRQAVIAFASYWGEQSFPEKPLRIVSRHGALPLIFWSPWDKPYAQERGPDRFGLDAILAGLWDDYIDSWADAARAFGKPMLVSWGLEMNGNWFPWSGIFYGEAPDKERFPEGPEMFKRAFQYVVERVRARGARNVLWGFHANNFTFPQESWHTMAAYYPGPEVVDWLGLSVYGKQFAEDEWLSFREAMDCGYEEIGRLDPEKPILIAEWGVAEFPGAGSKAEWIREAFASIPKEYTRVKAAVYWHERWKNADESISNLRVHSSPEALEAYRRGLAGPYWMDRPQYRPQKGGPAPGTLN